MKVLFSVGVVIIILFILWKPAIIPKVEPRKDLKNYNYVESNSSFSSSVIEVLVAAGNAYVLTFENDSLIFTGKTWNHMYSSPYLSTFIQEGDSLNKVEISDTISIIRGDTNYFFVLNKEIFQ